MSVIQDFRTILDENLGSSSSRDIVQQFNWKSASLAFRSRWVQSTVTKIKTKTKTKNPGSPTGHKHPVKSVVVGEFNEIDIVVNLLFFNKFLTL